MKDYPRTVQGLSQARIDARMDRGPFPPPNETSILIQEGTEECADSYSYYKEERDREIERQKGLTVGSKEWYLVDKKLLRLQKALDCLEGAFYCALDADPNGVEAAFKAAEREECE